MAIRIARLMADRSAWTPQVMTVIEPLPVAMGPLALPAPSEEQEMAMTDSVLAAIKRQVRRYGDASWKVGFQYGMAAPCIVRAARGIDAELIVVGLGHHMAIARWFGAETAARVVRQTDIPVLAVHPGARTLPRVAVVAMDFGDSSVRAAHEALALLEPPGRLHLVHVKWGYNTSSLRDTEWERAYNFGVESGFQRIRAELHAQAGIEITTDFLHGGVVKSILDTARAMSADLVALGSHSQTIVDRLMIGSTPAEVLREAPCSVLIAPPLQAT